MKYFLILFFLLAGCSKFSIISKKIDTTYRTKPPFLSSHQMRKILYKSSAIDFINYNDDTLILSHNVNLESLNYYGYIISNHGKVCYTYLKPEKKLELNKYGCEIDKYIIKWDTLALRRLEKEKIKNSLNDKITLQRVIIKSKKVLKKEIFSFIPFD